MKVCYQCGNLLPSHRFYSRNGKFVGKCKVCYNAVARLHRKIKANLVLDYCQICYDTPKQLDLACITKNHRYTENPKDYMLLCHKCHSLLDSLLKNRNNHSKSL